MTTLHIGTHTKNSENVNISPLHTVLRLQNHSEYYSIGGWRHPIKVRLRTLIRSLLTICCLSSISSCFSTSSIYVWRKGSVSALKSLRNTPRRKDIKVYMCGLWDRSLDGWMDESNRTKSTEKKKRKCKQTRNGTTLWRKNHPVPLLNMCRGLCISKCCILQTTATSRTTEKSTVIIHHLTVCVVSLILAWARQFTRLSFNNTEVALT